MRNRLLGQVKKERRRRSMVFVTFYIMGLVYCGTTFMLGDGGYLSYKKLVGVREGLRSEIASIQTRNNVLRGEVDSLSSDPEYIEKMARENLGLSRNNELIFTFEK